MGMSSYNLGHSTSSEGMLPLRAIRALAAPLVLFIGTLVFVVPLQAQRGEGRLVQAQPTGITVEEIISKFAEKEKEFQTPRERYTYRQSNIIQTLEGASVDGEYRQDWD